MGQVLFITHTNRGESGSSIALIFYLSHTHRSERGSSIALIFYLSHIQKWTWVKYCTYFFLLITHTQVNVDQVLHLSFTYHTYRGERGSSITLIFYLSHTQWKWIKYCTYLLLITHTLLFRTSEERTLRLHASLPATRWPRHACTRRERVSASRVVQAFFVPYENAGLQFQLSLWSCVRFSVCLGMILATWLKETFVYRAVKDVLAFEFFLGRNRECFMRTDIWHPPWASPRFACRAGLLCCLWKHGSTVPLVSWSCVRFEVCLGMIFATWLKETFVYHAVQDVLAFELFLGRNRECLVRTDIVVSESALRVSCRPYLLSVKTRVYCSSCLVVVCSFQDLSGNDIHYISEGDFH